MADALRRGRGVGAGGRLRRHPARLRERQAPRPVPVAVLQPPRPTSSAARSSAGRACSRLIREAVAERAGADFPCTVKVPAETAPPGFPRATQRRGARGSRARRGVGLRRGHAGRGLGVPRHDAVARRRARLVLDQPGHGARGCAGAAPTRRRRGGHQGRRLVGRPQRAPFAPVWNRELFTAVKAARRHPGARGRRHPHRRRGRARSSTRARPTSSGSAGRSTPSPTSPRRILGRRRRARAVPELQPLRPRADARHARGLLQPRGPPAAHPDPRPIRRPPGAVTGP